MSILKPEKIGLRKNISWNREIVFVLLERWYGVAVPIVFLLSWLRISLVSSTNQYNLALSDRIKKSLVLPLLKKASLDPNLLSKDRPISNLSFKWYRSNRLREKFGFPGFVISWLHYLSGRKQTINIDGTRST